MNNRAANCVDPNDTTNSEDVDQTAYPRSLISLLKTFCIAKDHTCFQMDIEG